MCNDNDEAIELVMSEVMDHHSYLNRICVGPNGMGVERVSGQVFTDGGWNVNIAYCTYPFDGCEGFVANVLDVRQRQLGTRMPCWSLLDRLANVTLQSPAMKPSEYGGWPGMLSVLPD